MGNKFKIESMLSARLFLSPQVAGDRIYFLSNMSGRVSLYAMDRTSSVPEPLLPPEIALQNPTLMDGESFFAFPRLEKILVMIDKDGDENYQPCFIPLDGGLPEPLFGDRFKGQQVNCLKCDIERNIAFFQVDPRKNPDYETFMVNLETMGIESLGKSKYGNWFVGANADYSKVFLIDAYTAGDHVLYLWDKKTKERQLLCGTPLDRRAEGETVPLNSIHSCFFIGRGRVCIFVTSLFRDTYGLGYMALDGRGDVREVSVKGTKHSGSGELVALKHVRGNRYLLVYNIDGCSYAYEGEFDEAELCVNVDKAICGWGDLGGGVIQSIYCEKKTGRYAVSFSTATSPSQIYTVEKDSGKTRVLTCERILGVPRDYLSSGEDASFESHDGLRISARLYLPSGKLGFEGKRPVIFYIHGGPQSQERPDFTWFSMPLIQFFTLNGFAVFVPNVRGSAGYGLKYMKFVDRDWGGKDRLDHMEALKFLAKDERLDLERVGVMGRSYGGYMTLTLASRHPGAWKAACDLWGPYDLIGLIEREPETWKTFFYLAVGHPEKDRDFLVERSPKTYMDQIACPLLVVQGKNDPRVREVESREIVDDLKAKGKQVEYLVFEDEGHDVLKFDNRVKCYNEIVWFFSGQLKKAPEPVVEAAVSA